jgi:hypothetical protein
VEQSKATAQLVVAKLVRYVNMADTATKKSPAKWERAKTDAKAKMGGKHSARAMQLATKLYKERGGEYSGAKSSDNKLSKWGKEDWGTKSGKNSTEGPKALSSKEYAATTRAKREGTAKGKQFVAQPKKIAAKTARTR